jgi:hypothetical protein
MISLKMEILDERAGRPLGNPFGLKCLEVTYWVPHFYLVKTGINLSLPDNMTLMLIPAQTGILVTGWNMTEVEGLKVMVMKEPEVEFAEPFVTAYVVEKKIMPVRFVEFAKEGGRMITGEVKEATNG